MRLRAARIVQLQVGHLADSAEVAALQSELIAAIGRAGADVVVCVDCRRASPVSREVSAALSRAMRETNRSIVKSAILVNPANTVFNLQLERVVRCAVNPNRQTFDDLRELRAWLGATLTEPERAMLEDLFSTEGV